MVEFLHKSLTKTEKVSLHKFVSVLPFGYDQLGEVEKEVLECGNCFNDVSCEQLPRYATVNAFFYPPLPNLSELNVIEECLVAAQLPFQ